MERIGLNKRDSDERQVLEYSSAAYKNLDIVIIHTLISLTLNKLWQYADLTYGFFKSKQHGLIFFIYKIMTVVPHPFEACQGLLKAQNYSIRLRNIKYMH